MDIQGFVTSHDDAMHRLFREQLDQNDYEILIGDIATRLATVFASLKVKLRNLLMEESPCLCPRCSLESRVPLHKKHVQLASSV